MEFGKLSNVMLQGYQASGYITFCMNMGIGWFTLYHKRNHVTSSKEYWVIFMRNPKEYLHGFIAARDQEDFPHIRVSKKCNIAFLW